MTVPDKLTRISEIPRFWAIHAPEAVAIVEGEQRTTFAQPWARIGQARAFLESRANCGYAVQASWRATTARR